ncbi:MAG TPA: AAA family ATPase [Arenimonas sp.]|uniref:ATP-dependent nuclease n=1 Tax=Arenimonas sp. TaxID=1872635 RepID=UPI002D7E1963|nr:AAA family ATPase [Arenimonas sp.]HEU0151804.1 AAA family ATPase [Arenimonas sp.]
MKYSDSQKDRQLRNRFASDFSSALLRRLILKEGSLRGLDALDVAFQYPITAIAGKNGAGKSTILALACCGFHNGRDGFKLPKRKNPYYTFSDFFVQHADETPPQGVKIEYHIAYNNWRKSDRFPDGVGLGIQVRKKAKGGKWNNYEDRVEKNVVFLGIERIVPHSERSQSRSYSRVFSDTAPRGWEEKVRDAVGFVLGRNYSNFRYVEHSKYSLPVVSVGATSYSGFNMGAGENALFEIFATIYSAGKGALLVLDEVELALHAEAQRRFMDRLKDVCLEMGTQVICTTHSKEIFDCLPYDARYFVEKVGGKTKITQGISSEFAFSKLAAVPGVELELLVEDDVAKIVLLACLPASLRSRLAVRVIGSATALSRQLAATSIRGETVPTVVVFDGDQRVRESQNLSHARDMCEKPKSDFDDWFKARVTYLPGETWPEAWLIQRARDCVDGLAADLGSDSGTLSDVLEYGLQAGKHKEFFEISRQLGIDRNSCIRALAIAVNRAFPSHLAHLKKKIADAIEVA